MLARFISSSSSSKIYLCSNPYDRVLEAASFRWFNFDRFSCFRASEFSLEFLIAVLSRACSKFDVWVFLVPIVVLSYAVLILFILGAVGVIGTFLFGFSNRIWGSHSPPLWSPIWSFNWYQSLVEVFSTLTGSKTTRRPWRVLVRSRCFPV